MNHRPVTINILQNDSWAASSLGGFIFMLVITLIVSVVNLFMPGIKSAEPDGFIVLTAFFFLVAAVTSVLRVRYVNQVFDNGVIVKAQVIQSGAYRSNLRMTLRYTYLSELQEKKVEQLITGKTKKLMNQNVVDLVIDTRKPERVLIWDVYC